MVPLSPGFALTPVSHPSGFFSPWFAPPARSRSGVARHGTQMFRKSSRKLFPFGCLPPWSWDRIAQHPGDVSLPLISLTSSSPEVDMIVSGHPQNIGFPPPMPPVRACWSATLLLCSGHGKPQMCEACWAHLWLSLLAIQSVLVRATLVWSQPALTFPTFNFLVIFLVLRLLPYLAISAQCPGS